MKNVGWIDTKPLTIERLIELADKKKSVYWVSHNKRWPAAFFQNWQARVLYNSIRFNHIMEVIE